MKVIVKSKNNQGLRVFPNAIVNETEAMFIVADNINFDTTEYSKDLYSYSYEDNNNFIKNDDGKLQWSLLPFNELKEVTKVLMAGAKKYTPDNWQKCEDPKRYEDALLRHVLDYVAGNKIDSVADGGDGLSHLAHAICNCLFLMWFDNNSKF